MFNSPPKKIINVIMASYKFNYYWINYGNICNKFDIWKIILNLNKMHTAANQNLISTVCIDFNNIIYLGRRYPPHNNY